MENGRNDLTHEFKAVGDEEDGSSSQGCDGEWVTQMSSWQSAQCQGQKAGRFSRAETGHGQRKKADRFTWTGTCNG